MWTPAPPVFCADIPEAQFFKESFKINLLVSFSSQVPEDIQAAVLTCPQTATQYYQISAVSVLSSTLWQLYQTAQQIKRINSCVQTICFWYLAPICLSATSFHYEATCFSCPHTHTCMCLLSPSLKQYLGKVLQFLCHLVNPPLKKQNIEENSSFDY